MEASSPFSSVLLYGHPYPRHAGLRKPTSSVIALYLEWAWRKWVCCLGLSLCTMHLILSTFPSSGIAGSIMSFISIIYLRSPSGLPIKSEHSRWTSLSISEALELVASASELYWRRQVTHTNERTIRQYPSQLLTQVSSSGSTPIESLLYALEG